MFLHIKKIIGRLICIFIPFKGLRYSVRNFFSEKRFILKTRKKFMKKNYLDFSKYKIISLGNHCFPRYITNMWGLKPTKNQGELSAPFDLVFTPLDSLLAILKNNFSDYFDDLKYDEEKNYWVNTKYNLLYVHDKDCGANDKDKLIKRFKNRINNFNNLINLDDDIFFIMSFSDYHKEISQSDYNKNMDVINNIYKLIENKRKNKKSYFTVISFSSEVLNYKSEYDFIDVISAPIPFKNYIWFEDQCLKEGVKWEKSIAEKIYNIIVSKIKNVKKQKKLKNSSFYDWL